MLSTLYRQKSHLDKRERQHKCALKDQAGHYTYSGPITGDFNSQLANPVICTLPERKRSMRKVLVNGKPMEKDLECGLIEDVHVRCTFKSRKQIQTNCKVNESYIWT